MANEETLMNVLSRLSYSIEEAMLQKRLLEKQLSEATHQVKILTEANDALMKHVAGLEKRNEVVVNGLMKIVDTVENNCRRLRGETTELLDTASAKGDAFAMNDDKNPDIDNKEEVTVNMKSNNVDHTSSPELGGYPISKEQELSEVILDKEPQSAEITSISEPPIDPLVFSDVMDYAAEPDLVFPQYQRRSTLGIRGGLLRSSRLRSGRLRSSRNFFRRRRENSHVDGSRSVESHRRRRSGGIRADSNTIPVPEANCGCFLQSVFGCRH